MLAAALHPPERQDFSAEADRARLSKVALKAYKRLVEQWGMTGQQAAALLDVSTSTWERLKQDGKAKSL
ncbi:MAG: antitoxin Xre-like helix-turn-helix domain-containing protein, partial [Devosia sp.]